MNILRQKNSLYAAVLATALLLSGCAVSDDPATETPSGAVTVQFSTRAVGASSSFTKGDQINVFFTTSPVSANLFDVMPFTFNGSAWLNANGQNYLYTELYVTLQAVYPTTENATLNSFELGSSQTAIDQSTPEKFKACDLMISTALGTRDPHFTISDWELKHQLSKITVTIAGYGEEYGTLLPTVADEEIYTRSSAISRSSTFNDWTSDEATANTVLPLKTTIDAAAGLYKYEALVVPGFYSGNTAIMHLTIDGTQRTLYLPSKHSKNLEKGKAYAYTLTVHKTDKLTLTVDATVPTWNEEEEEIL